MSAISVYSPRTAATGVHSRVGVSQKLRAIDVHAGSVDHQRVATDIMWA